jgi:RNA polymerase sigma-70 factor (ECF subfamily)
MSDARVTTFDRVDVLASAAQAFQMDEDGFGAFYERTSRPLWLYLARTSGDARLADDLLHEAYYRVLRSGTAFESDDHRRHYLFRVAANLVRDTHRRHGTRPVVASAPDDALVDATTERSAERAVDRLDVQRAMTRLSPRERSLLWLAYVRGCTHDEIAATHGVKRASLKTLLHRARRRLLGLLGADARERGRA